MKSRFDNRKAFEGIARQLGIQDKTHHVVYTDPITKKDSMKLVNNFNRFVKGMLCLSPIEQLEKLKVFEAKMEDLIKDQQRYREELEAEAKIEIKNPNEEIIRAATAQTVSDDPFKI